MVEPVTTYPIIPDPTLTSRRSFTFFKATVFSEDPPGPAQPNLFKEGLIRAVEVSKSVCQAQTKFPVRLYPPMTCIFALVDHRPPFSVSQFPADVICCSFRLLLASGLILRALFQAPPCCPAPHCVFQSREQNTPDTSGNCAAGGRCTLIGPSPSPVAH